MDTLHTWKKIILVIALCIHVYSNVHGATQTVCTKTDTTRASIPLNCSSNQMIHVIRELYGERTSEDDCSVVRADSHAKAFLSDKQGLVVNCNGRETCTENTACGIHCNGIGQAFEITYECVHDSKNICSSLHQTGPLPSLYLHSPGFPLSAGEEEGRSCECSVSGTDLEVMVIQYRGNKGGLQINTTGDGNKTWTSVVNHFNRNIASNVNKVITSFTKEGQSDTRMSVRIKGKITYILCSSALSTTMASEEVSDSIETTTKSGSETSTNSSTLNNRDDIGFSTEASSDMSTGLDNLQSTEDQKITKDEESSTVMTVSVVLSVIICLLLVIIGLLVYFKVIKPQRQRQRNTEETVTYNEPDDDRTRDSNEPVNSYSDLVRYENQDNNYGKLHLYANPEFCMEQTTGQ